jgi:hypothetical protein
MASTSSMTAKQMRALKQSKDSILLAEDQYPENLDAIFTKLTLPTTLQNTMPLLQWNRNSCDSAYDSALKSTIKSTSIIKKNGNANDPYKCKLKYTLVFNFHASSKLQKGIPKNDSLRTGTPWTEASKKAK